MADRCRDYNQICAQNARRFSLRLDLRMPSAWKRVDELRAKHRPGKTRIRLHVLRSDASGLLDLNGSHAVQVDAELVGMLQGCLESERRSWRSGPGDR